MNGVHMYVLVLFIANMEALDTQAYSVLYEKEIPNRVSIEYGVP